MSFCIFVISKFFIWCQKLFFNLFCLKKTFKLLKTNTKYLNHRLPTNTGYTTFNRPQEVTPSRRMCLKIKFTVVWCSLFIIATSQQPGNRAYWGSRWTITNAFFYQTIADFPRKNTWVLLLVIFDAVLDFGRCNARLRSANHTGTNASRFLDWRRNGKRKLVDVNSPFLLSSPSLPGSGSVF